MVQRQTDGGRRPHPLVHWAGPPPTAAPVSTSDAAASEDGVRARGGTDPEGRVCGRHRGGAAGTRLLGRQLAGQVAAASHHAALLALCAFVHPPHRVRAS
jgi:hypothetical protein